MEDGRYEHLIDFGDDPKWLNDNRRLLFRHENSLRILDTDTLDQRETLTIETPARLVGGFSLSRDNKTIALTQQISSGDLWMLTLE